MVDDNDSTPCHAPLERLRQRKDELKGLRNESQRSQKKFIHAGLTICLLLLMLPYLLVLTLLPAPLPEYLLNYVIIGIVMTVVTVSLVLGAVTKWIIGGLPLAQDIQEIEFEIELQEINATPVEQRAEKLLRINEFNLKRYYDFNISQNSKTYSLGLWCIVFGVALIAATLFLIWGGALSTDTKAIIAIVGSIGSFLTTYVATIYLKIHAEASAHLESFHTRLVETHRLLLGNVFASRIGDDQQRWKTLSDLAINISKSN